MTTQVNPKTILNATLAVVTFSLDEDRYAVPISQIKRIVRSVEITHLPASEENLLGVINLQGDIVPVIDLRALLNLIPEELKLEDSFIIAESGDRTVAFVAEDVNFVEVNTALLFQLETIISDPKCKMIEKIIKDPDGPIHLLNITELLNQPNTQWSLSPATQKTTK